MIEGVADAPVELALDVGAVGADIVCGNGARECVVLRRSFPNEE